MNVLLCHVPVPDMTQHRPYVSKKKTIRKE